jgi:hypothetical protein
LGEIIPGLARLVDGRWRIVLTGQRFTESDETLKALEGVKRTGSKYTFVSARGTRFNARGQWKPQEKLRTAANVPDVQLDDIRDDSYSAACSAPGVDERFARLLAGHRAHGYQDRCVKRHPAIVRPACDAVRAHYFGK